MKILLIGNYEFDGSTSMQIWASTLHRELSERGVEVELLVPRPVLGRLKGSSRGLGKWLGYFDRMILFPRQLKAAAAHADVVHVCDHGNAMYALRVPQKPVIVTCHDMHAVLGALGEVPDCPASSLGRILQRWICRGLRGAARVACVSNATLADARRILKQDKNLCVVLNALNYPFKQLSADDTQQRLADVAGLDHPFILHIGSNLKRKNREGVLRVFARASEGLDLRLVFAGQALSPTLIQLADQLQIRDKIIQVVRPSVEVIEALYNRAVALLFPSRYEGFGWPSIEAQACGCPVVASNIPPLVEAVGQSAMLHPLDDIEGMAASIRRLATEPPCRDVLRRRGMENVQTRFQTDRMMQEYLALYHELACQN
jgi:glycosyltransferase involved in cell wall biosynthesis